MATNYKNIVITPNRDTDAANVPVIRFSGGDATTNTDITLRVYTTQSGTLSFEGSAGQLFSITNDLTNTIFSVNDVSGIPSLEIDAAGLVKLAEFGGNVAVGRANATYKVDVAGTVNASAILINGQSVLATIAGANTAVGAGANAFTSATIAGANTAVGVGANAFTSATIAGANTAVGAGANTVGVAAFARANNSLLSSSYTASDVLTKLLTVDGSGSGLDADLLDGLSSASFMRTDAASTHTTGKLTVYTPAGAVGTVIGTDNLEVFQPTAGTDAFLTFHISGDYAANFGIDGTTNDLFYGGWSAGANKFRVWHAGNDGAASGLDADLLDGQHGSFYATDTKATAAFGQANTALGKAITMAMIFG